MSPTLERFALPEQLPVTVEELNALLSTVLSQINLIQARARVGEELTRGEDGDVGYLRVLLQNRDTLRGEIATLEQAETEHRQELADLLERASETPAAPAPATDPDDTASADTDVAAAAETVVETPPDPAPVAPVTPPAADNRPVNFTGLGNDDRPQTPAGPGWVMRPGAPGYVEGQGPVGFAHIGKALDAVLPGRKSRHVDAKARGSLMAQVIAGLKRDVPLIKDPHELVAEITRATTTVAPQRGSQERVPVTAESLVAAGGWCSPSETLYDFCDVPVASDLISLPEITIVRGGIRWPVEPDLSAIFESFEFFFTEPELEITDEDGYPSAIKECVDIPCPEDFEEMRLNVVGYCVRAGILQTQGWPELITWFTQWLVSEHLRAISRRTILDMVSGSTLQTFSSSYLIGTAGAVINSLELIATNLRLNRGLGREAAIEAVAPSWLYSVIRADVAYYYGTQEKAISDAEIQRWFSVRNIFIQLVGDWQTRGDGQPGNLNTVTWPGSVDVLMYPAGTWFRAMQNVIELGVMYPKEELIVNRYTRMFTEDAIAVASRCYPSQVARIPLNVSGGIGARYTLSAAAYTASSGDLISGAPVDGGPSDFTQGNQYTLAITGDPTSGHFVLAVDSNDGAQTSFNATAQAVLTALQGIEGYSSDDFFVTTYSSGVGDGQLPTDTLTITVPVGSTLTVASSTFGGGTDPAISVEAV